MVHSWIFRIFYHVWSIDWLIDRSDDWLFDCLIGFFSALVFTGSPDIGELFCSAVNYVKMSSWTRRACVTSCFWFWCALIIRIMRIKAWSRGRVGWAVSKPQPSRSAIPHSTARDTENSMSIGHMDFTLHALLIFMWAFCRMESLTLRNCIDVCVLYVEESLLWKHDLLPASVATLTIISSRCHPYLLRKFEEFTGKLILESTSFPVDRQIDWLIGWLFDWLIE